MSLAQEALVAVLAAIWIVGLVHQFDSLSATHGATVGDEFNSA